MRMFNFKKLEKLRKLRGLSLSALRLQLNKEYNCTFTTTTLSNHEKGKTTPNCDDLQMYVKFYGVPVESFFEMSK